MFGLYDPRKHILTFGGPRITQFGPGSMISCENTQDAFSYTVGGDGGVVRRLIPDESGTVTIRLLPISPANNYLAGLLRADRLGNGGIRPLLLKDLNGSMVCSAAIAWVRKSASVEVAEDVPVREWMIDCAKLSIFAGGVPSVGV